MITKLEQLVSEAKSVGKQKLSVACPYDSHTLLAVEKARSQGFVDVVLNGDARKISAVAAQHGICLSNYEIFDIASDDAALETATRKVSVGEASILMKGLISSEKYLKAVINRTTGLLQLGSTISHVGVLENPNLNRLLIFGDSAVLPNPDLQQKINILNSLVKMARILGNNNPKVAIIAATELISNAITAGQDAAIISKMSERGQLDCIADGPLGLDVAIDVEAADIKSVKGSIHGDADCLIFPNIEAGNAFYKANTKIANSTLASVLSGTKAPVVITSRADSILSKYYSILLAIVCKK
jgi:phosphate butyryltransferase